MVKCPVCPGRMVKKDVSTISWEAESVPKEEDKFIVWKNEDLRAVILKAPWLRRYFNSLVDAISDLRKSQGKGENKYLVCNRDEPYADEIWRVILEGEMVKVGIDPDETWTCGICGCVKRYANEVPVYDAECGECCPEHYAGSPVDAVISDDEGASGLEVGA